MGKSDQKSFKGSPRQLRALGTFLKLTRATDSVAARIQQSLLETELTPGQLGVLEALWHLGPMSHRALGRKLLRSDANMTTVIDNLEKRKLVRRARSDEDRRVVRVSMTAEGMRRIEQVFPSYAESVARFMSVLSEAEQTELARLCKKLGKGVSA